MVKVNPTVYVEMLRLSVVVVSLLVFANCCEFESNGKRAHCKSFADLRKAGVQEGWEKLNMVGNGEVETVRKDAFVNTPNVNDLQIKGIANRINRGALSDLKKLYELHLDDNELAKILGKYISYNFYFFL